ncbi:hypothetical protein CQA78_30395, partial [Klebsiella pneumoniae]
FIGMTEPSIIAAEPPNPLVNELIINAGYRKASGGLRTYRPTGSLFSPGGVGTAEELLYLLGFIGMTEPSIIAAEPPNPLVNELIINAGYRKA